MKILITGGSGFLGCRLLNSLRLQHEVFAPIHSEMNICDKDQLHQVFAQYRPEMVIHCAALSNTGYCEQHPEESFMVNCFATQNVAEAAQQEGAKLIFMSSDQVYNGTKQEGALSETAPLSPINFYGKHKLMTEKAVMEVLPSAIGLRLTWMYDRPDSNLKLNSNILVNLMKADMKGEPVKAAIHEHRGITNVWEVVMNIQKCFTLDGGIYNFGSENTANSYETFVYAAQLLGLSDTLVVADEERFKDSPRNIAMDTHLIQQHGIRFNSTQIGLAGAVRL